jgi:hypothetical protein
MRRSFALGRWDVTLSTTAKRAWTDLKVFRTESGGRHVAWGRLSLCVDDGTAECVPTCAECGSDEIGEVSAGDEGWTVCQSCRSIEQGYTYISIREVESRGLM